MIEEYKVYIHTNKSNGKKYVGITKQEPERRWQKGYGYVDNEKFYNAIKKYGWDNFEHEIIFSDIPKEKACDLEIILICLLNTTNEGYNISPGGELGVPNKRFGKDNQNSQAVHMIDPETNEIIATFEAQAEAARELGINRKGITKACLGECKTYMGYIWEYANKEYEKPFRYPRGCYPHMKQCKPVMLVEPDGREYHFNSVKEAAAETGVCRSNISRFCLGLRRDASGRRWSYEA